ncbi:nuclear transport factor 2 family protein [Burkholderia multivorans]|uniref:nuclear transport factor 2 family protein n=1 Tax=Burkholderia multivorans TaxID=87883 RepID=UPI0009E0DB39|nr:nuclear transport factor 2 family protein [Burkholderia multivorans]PRE05025.1 nuclear transport factor 2 family protein [Burkholderia multivorans]SAK18028.1 SnoaL-like domain protein [Burkholderia multivorans]
MTLSEYQRYIDRFNDRDATAFDDYLADDVKVTNGGLYYEGVAGMKAHYAKIWRSFVETLHVERYVGDGDSAAVDMWTHFVAERDDDDTPFGAVRKGDQFDYRGIVMYRIRDGKFTDIKVAYNSFIATRADGQVTSMGIPH